MINDKFLSFKLHKSQFKASIDLCLNIQYLMLIDKYLLTNANLGGIIYSQTENSSEKT